MPITRQRKEEIVSELTRTFNDAATVVFVHFHGLDVESERDMRHKLQEKGVEYTVAKKTLTKIALDKASIDGEKPALEGELALAFSSLESQDDVDVTAPARLIYNFGQEFGGAVSILGGIFEHTYKDKEEMDEIAQIPSLDVLRGMFVNVIHSPVQGLVIALNQISERQEA